jgi:hypothetical protein
MKIIFFLFFSQKFFFILREKIPKRHFHSHFDVNIYIAALCEIESDEKEKLFSSTTTIRLTKTCMLFFSFHIQYGGVSSVFDFPTRSHI